MAAPITSDWVTRWQWSWVGVLLVAVIGAVYGVAWVRVRRAGGSAAAGRLAALIASLGLILYLTCGPVGVFSTRLLWVFGLRVGLLSAVVPLGLALSQPVALIAAASGRDPAPVWKHPLARALTFPAVSSILAALSVALVFHTPYADAATHSSSVDALLVVHLLLVGLLVVLPLLGEGMLPHWATPGVRTLIAALDGLLDALPGILVMTSGRLLVPNFSGFATRAGSGGLAPDVDQRLAGGMLLAVAESIGIPMLIACFVQWMKHDEGQARDLDRELDAQEAAGEITAPWWLQEPTRRP